jgi:hypothetical protein
MDEPKRNAVVAFLDSQWLGIGVGVVAGAFGSLLSAKWLIVFGWSLICVDMLRYNFFNKGKFVKLFVNVGICCFLGLVFFLLWRFIPKPPEPLTRKDVQEAVTTALSTPVNSTQKAQPDKENIHLTTKAELVAAVRAAIEQYKSKEAANSQPAIPPISNSDLRKEVAAYTEHLRGIEGERDQAWRELFPITKGGMIAPEYDHAEHQQKWEKSERTIEDDFIKNDLGNGIRLRDELLKRLKQAGPPTPMNALLGAFPTPERGVPESELPFTQLADYLDALSSRLPNP